MKEDLIKVLALVFLFILIAVSNVMCESAALYLKTKVILKALE